MSSRRTFPMILSLFAASSILTALAPRGRADEPKLEASRLSFRAKDRSVADVLRYIESKTENPIRVVDEYGRPAAALLAQKISLTVKRRSFWEVIGEITEKTGTDVLEIEEGEVRLGVPTKFSAFHRAPLIGAATVVGPMRLTPGFNETFRHLLVSIATEPRLGRFEPGEAKLRVVPKEGAAFELEEHNFSKLNQLRGTLDLHFDLGRQRREMAPESLESVTLTGHILHVQHETREVGKLSALLEKDGPTRVGLVDVRVKSAGMQEIDGADLFVIDLDVEGPLVTQSEFVLPGPADRPLELAPGSSASLNDGVRPIHLRYAAKDVGKAPLDRVLSLDAPLETTKVKLDVRFTDLHAPKKPGR